MEDPDADTEWNDILREHGILPKKKGPTEDEIFEAMEEVIAARNENRLDAKSLDELDELEDEEDDRVLLEYRKKRMAELKAEAERAKYGQYVQISKPDFIREVTDASKEDWVIVHLFKDAIPECKLMNALLNTLAARYKSTKFLKIVGDDCIPGYPDRNLPTLLIYGRGDLQQQVVGIQKFGGMGTTIEVLEEFLGSVGAIEISKRRDPKNDHEENSSTRKSIYSKNSATAALSDDDDDYSDY
ncbi:2142_t:CDS:2 [Ambispora gerdemannii]|uniref:2142_t:CDS:1 n=1 Tax=Ambispora gerdemannii TaxID=144530 RepID=A0A9N8YRL1_9GLOM|nr:2142_t:CDS:2 [Ambispora gerdemannii]